MRKLVLATAALAGVASLSACVTAEQFFGTNNPCQMAENSYTAFNLYASQNAVSGDARRAAEAGIAAVRAQCADGDVSAVTLNKAVNAYLAAMAKYRGK